jgi:hypothetical protein
MKDRWQVTAAKISQPHPCAPLQCCDFHFTTMAHYEAVGWGCPPHQTCSTAF